MRTWTATTHVDADPEVVLDLLTQTDAVRQWAPVPFVLDDPTHDRLDWRTFRLDRLSEPATTGKRFVPRTLPAEDAAS